MDNIDVVNDINGRLDEIDADFDINDRGQFYLW